MEYIPAKQILSRNRSTAWFGTDYTMNLYRGCCHGCIYCDSRSACYGIEDFGRVRAKENALALLRDELRRKVRPGIVGMGSMSDPYNPFEGGAPAHPPRPGAAGRLRLRGGHRHQGRQDYPGHRRAALHEGARAGAVQGDRHHHRCRPWPPGWSRTPPAPPGGWRRWPGWRRRGCLLACCSCRFSPFWRTMWKNVRAVAEAAAEAGARFVYPAFGMTLRDQQREYYYQALEKGFPGLAERYRRQYGPRYECPSPRAKALWAALEERCRALGLLCRMRDITAAYQRGYGERQLTFSKAAAQCPWTPSVPAYSRWRRPSASSSVWRPAQRSGGDRGMVTASSADRPAATALASALMLRLTRKAKGCPGWPPPPPILRHAPKG